MKNQQLHWDVLKRFEDVTQMTHLAQQAMQCQ